MTPADHEAQAETMIARHANTSSGPSGPGYAAVMHAHAALSQAKGTGEHYESADELLAALKPTTNPNESARQGERALAHALLAER